VTVIIGAIFVLCVLAFRKGVVGEIQAYIDRRRARAAGPEAAAVPAEATTSQSAARSGA
jgi:hypothetical protein